MNSSITTTNTTIPIAKMVNDLFIQWLSLPETRSTLSSALHCAKTNSKMPDVINYSKIYTTRGSGFSKSQHFDSPPVSPVPRAPSSPRIISSTNVSINENTSVTSSNYDDKRKQSSKSLLTTNNGTTNTPNIEQPASAEKVKTPQINKPEIAKTSPSSNRSSFTASLGSVDSSEPKQSQQTSLKESSPVTTRRDSSSLTKVPNTGIISTNDSSNITQSSPIISTKKVVNEQVTEQVSTETKLITRKVEQSTPISVKTEQKTKVDENIPRFYFPDNQIPPINSGELTKQLRQIKDELFVPKNDKLHLEDFGKLSQLIGLTLYWKAPLFRACVYDNCGLKTNITSATTVSFAQFESFWKKVCKTNHDNALKFIYLLIHSLQTSNLSPNRQYLSVDDWECFVQDIIDTHPGLKFLREAREFHSRYIKTVVARIYYNCNRSWTSKLTVQEIRRSNLLATLDRLEKEDDINRIHDYFSYEHFYVIYCKFWELDSDHDLFISREDLAKHNNGAISTKMIDRIFSGAVSNSKNIKEGKMSYYEFVWFIISEEDKRSPTSIEYWFRCMDMDGDGILSMYELDYFYQEQVHKMEIYGIEYMSFEDCICQMLDLVKPEEDHKIRLKDLKGCKLTNIFFDTFFNLEKYLDNEQKDPFSNLKDPDTVEESDWVKYATTEYDNLTHEDGADNNGDDDNYDEDFEDDDPINDDVDDND